MQTIEMIKKHKLFFILMLFVLICGGILSYQYQTQQNKAAVVARSQKEAYARLSLEPNPVIVKSTSKERTTITVRIEVKREKITGVDLELSYDPYAMQNVDIEEESYFKNPTILKKKIDPKKGTISFALAIAPNQNPRKGNGKIASIKFSPGPSLLKKPSVLNFLPSTAVTAEGEKFSVLKGMIGATLIYKEIKP